MEAKQVENKSIRLLLPDYLKPNHALLQGRDFGFGVGELLALPLQHVGLGVLHELLVRELLQHRVMEAPGVFQLLFEAGLFGAEVNLAFQGHEKLRAPRYETNGSGWGSLHQADVGEGSQLTDDAV